VVGWGWGLVHPTTASILAVLGFNLFFLPPYGALTIAEPQNWIAFVAFLMTAVVASQLSGRARQRALDAAARQRDLERLYALSRALLLSEPRGSIGGQIARHIADAFELPLVGLYDQRADVVAWAGSEDLPAVDARLREVARRAETLRAATGLRLFAIHLGGAPIGSLGLRDAGLSDTVLNSIANLAAIGLERARADDATAGADASRQNSELRATVLDAVAHEFKTPLTVMKAASSDLRTSRAVTPRDRELIAIVDEELDYLGAVVSDAVQMLRLEAGDFRVRPARHNLAALVRAALERFERRLDGREVVEDVPPDLTIDADGALIVLALRQLLDNAVKYSPHGSRLEVRASRSATVDIAVRNVGSLIPDTERTRIFERFYRGAQSRHVPGTGMGLAIVQDVATAHGGALTVSSAAAAGTTFTLSLPVASVVA
jgi:two-component system sensor histidine kinase KdpD